MKNKKHLNELEVLKFEIEQLAEWNRGWQERYLEQAALAASQKRLLDNIDESYSLLKRAIAFIERNAGSTHQGNLVFKRNFNSVFGNFVITHDGKTTFIKDAA